MKAPSKLSSVILWSVISAAFIGPGTVTTAVTAGSTYGHQLLWAVAFSTFACIVLQELSARITISSEMTFGQMLIKRFGLKYGKLWKYTLGGVVIAGCAAYQAGNILGAVSGLRLMIDSPLWILTVLITTVSVIVLWTGRRKAIAATMTVLVACMGVAFAALAFTKSSIIQPTKMEGLIPPGSELLLMGLIGTTIVPYNIFIGSGISKGQTIPLMRTGLVISVLIGGLITMAIVFAGTAVKDFASFESLAATLQHEVGTWAFVALAMGLFAAGFSSSMTAPYASGVIAASVFGFEKKSHVRLTWGAVMLIGFLFGISGIKPIPVILTVQALNGLILPLLTLLLTLMANDPSIVKHADRHKSWYNLVLLVILMVMLLIGFSNVDKAVVSAFDLNDSHLWIVIGLSSAITLISAFSILKREISAY